jgi:glycosyltransferase involved in cell wall biosynthesis
VAAVAASAPEVLRDVGLLVPPDDPETLASAIEGLFADPQARVRRGALGVARAAGFSWKAAADRYRAVMMEVRG